LPSSFLTASQFTADFLPIKTNSLFAVTAQVALPVGGQLAFVDTGEFREQQENPPLSAA